MTSNCFLFTLSSKLKEQGILSTADKYKEHTITYIDVPGAARRGGRAATGASVRARTSAMRRRAGLATGSESGGSTSISSREGAPGRRRAKSPDAKSPRSVPGPEPVAVVGTRRMATHRRAYSPRGGL